MPLTYVRAIGKRPYAFYDQDQLKRALDAIKQGKTLRKAAEEYGVPRSTLSRYMNNKNTGKCGRPPVFNETEEICITECTALAGDWGFPLTKYDIRCLVKCHLDRKGIIESRFQNNLPGPDWTECYLNRHKETLTNRLSQNIKRSRAAVDEKTINEYFDELDVSLKDVDPALIVNYDETNLTDDPKRQRVIVRRSCRHPEKIIDHSKSSTSVMFAGAGDGHILPVYINYKAENLYNTWTSDGLAGTIYNRTRSGWFTMETIEDWFRRVAIPYFGQFEKDKANVLIDDNLSSHISKWVIDKCTEENIRFILLPANSTGLCQPLDVAFFKPLKSKWTQVIYDWKMKHRGVIPKDTFPRLLKKCLEEMTEKTPENIRAGFKGSGLIPLNRNEVLKRLPQTKSLTSSNDSQLQWVESFKDFLKDSSAKETQSSRLVKKNKLNAKPGASVINIEGDDDVELIQKFIKKKESTKNKKRIL